MISAEIYIKLEFNKIQNILKNYCVSALGLEYIDNMIFYTDAGELKAEFEKLTSLRKLIESDNDIQLDNLKDIRDILDLIRIPGNYVPPEKYLLIRDFLNVCRNIKSRLNSLLPEDNLLALLAGDLFVDKLLIHHIESIIDNNGTVKDKATKNLYRIRSEIISKKDVLRKLLDKILKRVSEQEYTQDDIITLRDGRSVIPVKVENKRKVPGIIHSSSATGLTVFIEPAETTELNNELTELHFEELREVEKILGQLAHEINKFSDALRSNCKIAGEIEFIRAKALFAIKYNCSEPVFDNGKVNIIEAYHPLLLLKIGKSAVVPLNCCVNESSHTIIITGPNAGGKTVSLKTIGLLQLMLQCGLHIPVSPDSSFRLFESIYVVIGDDQSIENDLSSFSSHLRELREVINNSNRNTLVLIDEICSGTDPRFGSALAISVLEHISAKNTFTVVTTHNGDLKIYAEKNDKFTNASLEFDFEKLNPSFRFRLGIPGQSFTFELAEKIRIPSEIIKKAISFISEDEYQIEEILGDLNRNRTEYEALRREYAQKLSDIEIIENEYILKMSEISKKEEEIIRNAKDEAGRMLIAGRKSIEQAIKAVREKEKNFSDIKKEFAKATEELIVSDIVRTTSNQDIKKGDTVKLADSGTTGIVSLIEGNVVFINSNNVIIKADISSVELADSHKHVPGVSGYRIELREAFNSVLDIRGKYTSEINEIIENFIYEGHINNMNEITIVHGKGTGRLKLQVHSILKNNKYIRKFRLGNWNEGDSGVTIVELIK
ncbi:MAG: endonuclease MutS2 [Ignavibacteria bacterium]|nr:endonuclease MutS2 [Ignavibacteria bacterium]